jgi:D-xylonolactonase
VEPKLIADYRCVTGEGPLWHEAEQRLYWADIPNGRLFRYDPATGAHEQVFQGDEAVGGYTIQADGALLLFMARGAIRILRDGRLVTVIDEIPDERESRFNDVIADPMGRIFCGTMPSPDGRLGRLYRLDPDGTLTQLLDGIGCSNGMGFTLDRTRMYYTDSTSHVIYLFDYDQATGALTNQRDFVRTPPDRGLPDGMAVDGEGHVWSARWDDWALYRFNPAGEQEARITFPAKKVSSITFGGPDYTDAYVTTAGGDDKTEGGVGAGALFRIRPGVRGQPAYLSRIGL